MWGVIGKVLVGQFVHKHCRRDFGRKSSKESYPEDLTASNQITSDVSLDEICFFCGCPAKYIENGKRRLDVEIAKTSKFIENLPANIAKRSDEWSQKVANRIEGKDLLNATYHKNCNIHFQTLKSIPLCHGVSVAKQVGRPQNQSKLEALSKVVKLMESAEDEIFSIKDLVELMQQECDEIIENRYLKKKLLEYFGERVLVITNDGKPDLLVLSQSVKPLINKLYEQQLSRQGQSERDVYVSKAADIIKSEVLVASANKECYPSSETLSDVAKQNQFLPNSLRRFLSEIFVEANCELKIASIGQAIMQAMRPRTIIAPLQIGLGVQLHHAFKSKFLIETLHKMGFSSSYSEVLRFRYCAASTVEEIHPNPNQMVKFVADNIDHDTRTIDGKGTFHGMGIIAAFTPGQSSKVVVRSKATIEDVKAVGQIEVLPYSNKPVGHGMCYEDVPELKYEDDFLPTTLLLNTTWLLRTTRPSWSGIMQLISHGSHPGNSSIKVLPMIDLAASDPTCIFSALHFLCKEAEKYGVTPIITFDQPLWWKASLIIQDEPVSSRLKKIVLLLGGFHMQMSFLGSIGYLMTGTGLQECLETVYAPNSVIHMLSGKAIQRAVRGHFLVSTAVNALITKKAESILPKIDWNTLFAESADLYDQLISLQLDSDELCSNKLLKSLTQHFTEIKNKLLDHRTAKLWIQYIEMVDLLRDFIRSERTGNWKLHLATVQKKIPYFIAAGHNNYAKSSQIYLKRMQQLEHSHPDVYKHFMSGHHVVRRSDRFWAGLSCDLTIEQTLMRAAKSRGGFTRGGGCSEVQRMVWIQSMPACTEVNIAMQKITHLHYETSEQHKDCSESMQARNEKDTKVIFEFLEDRDPFSLDDVKLRSIHTGEEAPGNVNVDDASKIGSSVLSKMIGQDVSTYSFENANKAVTMGSSSAILIDGKVTHIDPQLLFQRLMLMARNFNDEKLKDVFKYELSQSPSSLFDDAGLMREAKTNEFVKQCIAGDALMYNARVLADLESNSQHVLCGNLFLNRVVWKKNQTFRDICLMYVDYAKQFSNPVIVFDCVPDRTTMDEYHFRRSKGIRGVNIKFSGHTVFNSKKEHFMANKSNRDCFMTMLSKVLIENGCTVMRAERDQNMTIARTATEMALTSPIVVTANDMEIIIMLCYRFQIDGYDIIYSNEECSKKPPVRYSIRSIREKHDQQAISSIYFLHAIGGCKTTSHLHSIGKAQPLKKFEKSTDFRSIAGTFLSQSSTMTEVVDAGFRAITILYDGNVGESLNELRFKQFSKKVSTKKSAVLVNSLPPTSGAAKYHALRVYFQIQEWLGSQSLDPAKFGWKVTSKDCSRLTPITSDMEPAPPELLSKIRCQCKGDCSTLKCGCKKNQVKCSSACAVCCGTDCLNIDSLDETEDETSAHSD
ncbi:uncharacterized protein LOC119079700 [Bradysia coprophila]|uniref:uncharacterized protein LOC119079700 n=1 Tax=Bradysia coprophila TaxID=38358 RepID=UPI00187D89C3|nr:uncharacterized protein LOC119079700 [Bradysia coprophila]